MAGRRTGTGERKRTDEKSRQRKKIIDELNCIAFANIDDVFSLENGVLQVKGFDEIPMKTRRAIAYIKEGSKGLEVKMWDKQKALSDLIRLDEEKEEGSGGIIVNVVDDKLPLDNGEA